MSLPGREEQRGEERRQRRVEIEVVPLEDGAERRGEDDEFLVLRHASGARRSVVNSVLVVTDAPPVPQLRGPRLRALSPRVREARCRGCGLSVRNSY